MQVFCFHLNSKSYPIVVPDVFPLAFRSRSIAIRYASYHFQNRSVPTPLRYKNHAEKNMFQWKQKAYPIWKLERSHSDPVWWKHSIKQFATFTFTFIGKFLCCSQFLIKLQLWRPVTLLKRESNTGVFLWILEHFKEDLFWRTSANDSFCRQFLKSFICSV